MNYYLGHTVVSAKSVCFLVRAFLEINQIKIPVPFARENLQRMSCSREPLGPTVEINVAVREQQKNGMLARE